MTEKKSTQLIGLRIKQETAERIKRDAASEELNSSDIIRRAINRYYEEKDSIKA